MKVKPKSVELDDEFSIRVDAHNWTLVQEVVGGINPKTKKPTISRNEWHLNSLKLALRCYADKALKQEENVTDLITKLNEVQKTIENFQGKLTL